MTSELLRHFAPYGSTNALCDETVPRGVRWDEGTGEYVDDRFTVQRDRVTCPDCRYGLTLVGESYDERASAPALTPEQMDEAHRIREAVGPMLRQDGRIDARAIAQEATLRSRAGLPGWIAQLDAPGPRRHRNLPCSVTPILPGATVEALATAAARLAAHERRPEMAEGTTEKRESWDDASDRGSTIAQFATMDPSDAVRELEARSVEELRQLAYKAGQNADWHRQGIADSQRVREAIGRVLRTAGEDADPQMVAAESIRR